MTYQLVSIGGDQKGTSWPLFEGEFLLGRDDACHIHIADPMVSRQHCRLRCEGSSVLLEDAGSRNETLINGLPSRKARLKVGDQIAVGKEVFLLANGGDGGVGNGDPGRASSRKTVSIISGGTLELSGRAGAQGLHGRARTIHELAQIYEISQRLVACRGIAESTRTLRRCLLERFKPLRSWIGRVYGDGKVVFDPVDQSEHDKNAAPPIDDIQRAVREMTGHLFTFTPEGGDELMPVFTLISPVVHSGICIAVLVLQISPPEGVYDQNDLEFLTLLAQFVAPFVRAADDLEYLRRDNERLRSRAGESVVLVGSSPVMNQLRSQILTVAETDLNVLIMGDTGTGKELVTRMIHQQSRLADAPLIVMNCASIPENLFESTLFGHKKGAFTGAIEDQTGLMELAHGGILFLDEVGDLNMDNQARILRTIEYGTFRRVGGQQEKRVDVRFVAATNKNIPNQIRQGHFREDLYHRLNSFELYIPALRGRPSDIPVLARHFFDMSRPLAKHPLEGISPAAMNHLCERPWTGNVRELSNCIQRAVALAKGATIEIHDVVSPTQDRGAQTTLGPPDLTMAEVEQLHIERVLRDCDGNVRKAAKKLGLGKSTLYKRIVEYSIEV